MAVLAAGLLGASPAGADELSNLATRTSITLPVLLIRPAGAPTASVVLFAGGHGHLALSSSGIGWGQNNFPPPACGRAGPTGSSSRPA